MSSKRYEIRWTEVDGRKVRYRVMVPDPSTPPRTSLPCPVLMIHGLGCSSDTWSRTMREFGRLRADQLMYAVDMPGYGRSDDAPQPLGIDELAGWCARFLDAIEVDKVDVAANSMGCQVAVTLASRYPERVRRMVLLGPTIGDGVTVSQYGVRLLVDSVREPLWYNLRLTRMYAEMGPVDFLRTVKNMIEDPTLANAASVQAPTLVARGNRDAIVTRRTAQRLAAALPYGEFAEIDRSAHAAEFSRPKMFVRTLISFLLSTSMPARKKLAGLSAA